MDNEFPPASTASPGPTAPMPPPLINTFVPPPRNPKTGRGWKITAIILALVLFFLLLSQFIGLFFGSVLSADGLGGSSRLQETTIENNRSGNKIAVIPIEGVIMSASLGGGGYGMVELVEDQLKLAGKDEQVKAVLLKVNSPGGEVLASDDIYNAIVRFQNDYKKPVVASMGSLAASGGYYVSAPCRWIVANELTITGSIGVIMHTYNYRGLMNKIGLRPMIYKSGRFKDMLSGEKDLEQLSPTERAAFEEEEAMVRKMITETFAKFRSIVAEGRQDSNRRNSTTASGPAGRPLSGQWTNYADGRILSGKEAHEHGFVDELGGWRVAVGRAKKLAGIDDADLVTYQMPFNLGSLFGMLGKSEARSIKVDLGFDLPKLDAGLYYLAPTFLR